jgi:hypothetical protein
MIMARRGKQYVFSARTTEGGLRLLGELRQERRMGWDDLVIDAMCAHYDLDRAVMALPKREKPAEEAESNQQPAEDAGESHLEVGVETPAEEPPKKKRGKGKNKK